MVRLVAAGAALVLGLTACGGGGDAGTPKDTSAGAAPGYPITITHKLGTTTIKAAPKRIVVLGETDQDALLALGIQPIATIKTSMADGIAPWSKAKVTGATPTLLTVGDNGIDVEQVLKLEPDLILAGYDFYIDKYWKKLNDIVPTTAFQTGPVEDTWQQVTRQVGQAVGKSAEADKLVTEVEGKIAGIKTSNPELTGKKFAFGVTGRTGTMNVLKSAGDSASKLFGEFGMVLPPAIQQLPGASFAAELSAERFDVLDQDVLVTYYNGNQQHQREVEQNPLFSKLKVVSKGGNIVIDLTEFYSIRNPSPLGIPYAIDKMVPKLSAAVKKTAA
ncbi:MULTISPECIES: iron-siderophore ABC transporter substrate-binding protein [unclassified Crossiella]|uniref:iron-siderophore ABC transporter substrate-binding protein n=1 Tax=unclassified Crossiella TaxID=2620835 RepID=UPI001FFEB4DE|nr:MULTISPECIES: iron-siderophore ABC transporter substrate-binding protein [unclassified Crossiella]MCK2245075.1 iron-siderophore ABC transporter substrate-binding protein [Crossiella sp. S99.2]MCK2258656.1 iron-siderophore ABC transporter substrate-binding protein [Crossiella sp. S99.1]